MDKAYKHGQVPPEKFVRCGGQSSYGVLCKVLLCDMIRVKASTWTLMMVVMTLSILQKMAFFLITGYDIAEQGYGGTIDNYTFGYGHGSGMSLAPGFLGVSALMSNEYCHLGHGFKFVRA